jgi:hypothetical protein
MVRKCIFLPVLLFILVIPVLGRAQPSVESLSCSEKDAQSLLSAFMSYTDLPIRSVQRSLKILASTNEARSGNWRSMEESLRGYEKSETGLIVWYVRPDGTYYTADKELINKWLSDRSNFRELIAGKEVRALSLSARVLGSFLP